MIGAVRQTKPNASPEAAKRALNARIRTLMDARPYWCDLLETYILSVPAAYATGTVSLAQGSALVTGVSTAWPVSDLVNTTIPSGVDATGFVPVTPASMAGITEDSILLVDAAVTPESVAVVELREFDFVAQFRFTHNPGCTLQQSSLAGRQFRLGSGHPIFQIRSVRSQTSLELDIAWGGAAVTASAYQILKMYYSLGQNMGMIQFGVDPQSGQPIQFDINAQMLNYIDPQRTRTGSQPEKIVEFRSSPNGGMLYELWPAPTVARQCAFIVSRRWSEMETNNDRPPWFINSQVIIDGATADVLRQKVDATDPWFNPQLAREYEIKFRQGMEEAKAADEARAPRDYHVHLERIAQMNHGGLRNEVPWGMLAGPYL